MEAFIQMTVLIAVFALGVGFGAILESRLMKFRNTENRIKQLENTTQEIKIVMSESAHVAAPISEHSQAWVDYGYLDPEATQELNLNG